MVGWLLYEGRPSHESWVRSWGSCGWPRLLGPAPGSGEGEAEIVASMLVCGEMM